MSAGKEDWIGGSGVYQKTGKVLRKQGLEKIEKSQKFWMKMRNREVLRLTRECRFLYSKIPWRTIYLYVTPVPGALK